MRRPKIFGIGLAKTGTTSLSEALRILGYSTIDFPLGLRGVEDHDAATDIPVADSFELLDRRYPGSKFVYTIRERRDWLKSSEVHWARSIDNGLLKEIEKIKLIERLYGIINFDAKLFAEAYDRHEMRVVSYFSERPSDLLVIDICSGKNGWEPLCTLLGQQIPRRQFPHVNKTKNVLQYMISRSLERPMPMRMDKKIRKITFRILARQRRG
jgi:hypothetical protein